VLIHAAKNPVARRRPLPFRRNGVGPSAPGPLFRAGGGDIVCADALRFLKSLPDSSVDVVFLDPPFNLGKRYGPAGGSADRLPDDEYYAYMWLVLRRAIDVLRDGGALLLYHVPKWAIRLAPALNDSLVFRHWIAISMKNGFARTSGLYPAHYSLLHFTKGRPRTMRRPKIMPARCPHCKNLLKSYGGYKRFVTDGINLSDVWDDLSPVRHRKHKTRIANELPRAIPDRALGIVGTKGGVLVDPFAGAGTVLRAAADAGMRFIGCDLQMANCRLMYRRLP